MGNYRFRFSDMIPNAWFYKLKDMNKTTKHYTTNKKKQPPASQKPHNSKPRYFPSEPFKPGSRFHHLQASAAAAADPSSLIKRRDRRRTVYKPSPRVISSIHHHHSSLYPLESSSPEPPESLLSDSEEDDEFFNSNSYECQLSPSTTDIIIDMEHNRRDFDKFEELLDLPPILTKPPPPKSNHHREPRKSFGTSSHGIKLRSNSPKIASKKIQGYGRKSLSPCSYLKSRNRSIAESFAVVKSSYDPQRDFRDSMVEMIVENNIRSSKELEDLLACYLSLNSNQYHHLIIKAFEQIWLDMTNLRL